MVSYNQLAVTVGIVVAYLVDLTFSGFGQGAKRRMFSVHVIPATILGVGMFFVPNSPHFLVVQGKEDEARQVRVNAFFGQYFGVSRTLVAPVT